MCPFVPGLVADCYAADGYLADIVRETGFRADGAEERVPAVGDGGGVQESEVECLEGARSASGFHAFDDCFFFWGGDGVGVDVGETHFGGGGGCEMPN